MSHVLSVALFSYIVHVWALLVCLLETRVCLVCCRLVESLRGKLTWLSGEAAFVEHLQAQLDDATRALHDAATDIAALDLYHHDHAAVQDKIQVRRGLPAVATHCSIFE